MAKLLYGTGLRLMECSEGIPMGFSESLRDLRLRVKDIDFEPNQIIVRDGKGMKDK